ncbi:hypothetical protein D3C76_733180 [compost metagenome]
MLEGLLASLLVVAIDDRIGIPLHRQLAPQGFDPAQLQVELVAIFAKVDRLIAVILAPGQVHQRDDTEVAAADTGVRLIDQPEGCANDRVGHAAVAAQRLAADSCIVDVAKRQEDLRREGGAADIDVVDQTQNADVGPDPGVLLGIGAAVCVVTLGTAILLVPGGEVGAAGKGDVVAGVDVNGQ